MGTCKYTDEVDKGINWFSNASFNYVFDLIFKFRQFKLSCLFVESVPERRASIVA